MIIKIDGITYEVVQAHTPDDVESAGRKNTADAMRSNGCSRHLVLRRPKGRVLYISSEWPTKWGTHYKEPLSMGRGR